MAPVKELRLSHLVAAPRDAVFEAFSEPAHLAEWWGPDGFTNPVCVIDFREGGLIRIDMRGPDGTIYPMTGTYIDIHAPEKCIFDSSALDSKGKALFVVRTSIRLDAEGVKTRLHLHAAVLNARADADRYLEGMAAGWTQSLGRLDRFVTSAEGS